MNVVTIEHLVILKAEATKQQIEALNKLTGPDKVTFNGKIIITTDFKGFKYIVKKEVAEIFSIKESEIYITISEL